MSEDNTKTIEVEVSLTDIDVVADAFDSIAESLEDIAYDAEPNVRVELHEVVDEAYDYADVIGNE